MVQLLAVLADYREILKALESHGLAVNPTKCELHLIKPQSEECRDALESFRCITPGVVLVDKANLKRKLTPNWVMFPLTRMRSKTNRLNKTVKISRAPLH